MSDAFDRSTNSPMEKLVRIHSITNFINHINDCHTIVMMSFDDSESHTGYYINVDVLLSPAVSPSGHSGSEMHKLDSVMMP